MGAENKEINHSADETCGSSAARLLSFIRTRGLESPALMMLELYRPLVGLGDAALIFSQPFLKAFSMQSEILEILRNRADVDWLISELESKTGCSAQPDHLQGK